MVAVEVEARRRGEITSSVEYHQGMEVGLSVGVLLLRNHQVGEALSELVTEELEAVGLGVAVWVGEGEGLSMEAEGHEQRGL